MPYANGRANGIFAEYRRGTGGSGQEKQATANIRDAVSDNFVLNNKFHVVTADACYFFNKMCIRDRANALAAMPQVDASGNMTLAGGLTAAGAVNANGCLLYTSRCV